MLLSFLLISFNYRHSLLGWFCTCTASSHFFSLIDHDLSYISLIAFSSEITSNYFKTFCDNIFKNPLLFSKSMKIFIISFFPYYLPPKSARLIVIALFFCFKASFQVPNSVSKNIGLNIGFQKNIYYFYLFIFIDHFDAHVCNSTLKASSLRKVCESEMFRKARYSCTSTWTLIKSESSRKRLL